MITSHCPPLVWTQHAGGDAVLTARTPAGVGAAFACGQNWMVSQFHGRAGRAGQGRAGGDSKSTGFKAQHAVKMQLETNVTCC